MKVCIATGHDPNYKELAAITLPSWKNYCKKHGYYLLYDGEGNDKDSCKFRLYRQAYASGEFTADDVFAWADTDALCMNSERKIESIVYEHMPRWAHFLIGTDPNGLNSGFYIARFTPEALVYLSVCSAIGETSGYGDQEPQIQTSIKQPHKDIYKEVPGRVFNSTLYPLKGWNFGEYGKYINEYEEGDFVLHLAGVDEPARSNVLREYAAKAR